MIEHYIHIKDIINYLIWLIIALYIPGLICFGVLMVTESGDFFYDWILK